MESQHVAGLLLRLLRLQKNWSQETLCHGICAVSYLSKIEQGKVEANAQLLAELFERLGATWKESPDMAVLRDELYEGIFSWNDKFTSQKMKQLEENWDQLSIDPCYVDFVVIRAFHNQKPEWVSKELEPLLEPRQRALLAILRDQSETAYRVYPCPLTALFIAQEAFHKGNYMLALEYSQMAYDQAAREGHAYLMLYSQHFMAASYSDMGNLDAMYRHSQIAERLGYALGEADLVSIIQYNIAATKTEYGDYEGAYDYFSALQKPDVPALHKLAVCCEALGKKEEALDALNRAEHLESEFPFKEEICGLVRYRLEHSDYLHDPVYGELLMRTYERIEEELPSGFARFHLRWVAQWLTANRQYRKAFEVLQRFPQNQNLGLLNR
ncbi:MAG: helix-turn-helix domain-containing protein [Oscillospiraceae bacterium]|nr:helix-turn-helix domain-containing protein [Oscillospiraceae bacterium]